MENSTDTTESLNNLTGVFDAEIESPYKPLEMVFIVIVTGSLSLVTIFGNILVIVSIKLNRHLQTINNYFLFSLACADLIIGVFSMNIFTIYTVSGYWPLGPVICDLWLSVDYVASNASGMNLLVISFDRYFCVTKPLSYPLRRTAKVAGLMIAAVWVLSFIMWAPAIIFWPFIVGKRTVGEGECYVQLFSNPVVTFGTAVAAFYLPVIIMVILYVQISHASKSRIQDDNKETGSSKCTVPHSQVKGKIMKRNNWNTFNVPNVLANVKMQNEKTTGEAIIKNCCQGNEKELSNESTFCDVVQSEQKDGGTVQESVYVSDIQSHFRMDNSKFSILKIVREFQKCSDCGRSERRVSGLNSRNRNDKENGKDNKIITMANVPVKKKNKGAVSRGEKVTRTILAILLAFIITWSPYFVTVLINTFCSICIPSTLWTIGFWVAYINSTINPACYALCNPTFKKTFRHLLLCEYNSIGGKG
ncbi:muscarinic acetylcholine receptor M2-like [Scyliorhinus canicula]|uniref:muscarinic acetylcholine receptor M2-like n=1 Tax=Scyliorhinus canicula TaxID=7830 RepID=UPI0018F3A17C|nr:muscarinic acetylcholine receptor M2-like [Scyliorhinus canicula]